MIQQKKIHQKSIQAIRGNNANETKDQKHQDIGSDGGSSLIHHWITITHKTIVTNDNRNRFYISFNN